MRFWDSSAVVSFVAGEPSSAFLDDLLAADSGMAVWWATPVECASALARKARRSELAISDVNLASDLLYELTEGWIEIPPTDRLRDVALRLVRVHDLRAADAFQLAAAIVVSEDRPETLELVTLDDRLALAASREGFRVTSLQP